MLRRSGIALWPMIAAAGLALSPTTIVNIALADDSAGDHCTGCPTLAPTKSGALPRAAVISGGVSLGAYQAGFLEYFLRYQRVVSNDKSFRNLLQTDVPVDSSTPNDFYISGASAGSITALMTGLRQCYEPDPDVEKELMFTVWKGISLPKMLAQTKAEPDSLVGKASIEGQLATIQEQWDKITTWRPCSVYFGATVTRLTPRDMSISETLPNRVGATVPKLTEKFLVHISTDSRDKKPVIEAIRSPFPEQSDSQTGAGRGESSEMFPLLASPGGGVRALELHELLHLAQASASVPLAFPPTVIPHQLQGKEGNPEELTTVEAVRFVDGGILNNNPLDLVAYLFRLKRGPNPTEKASGEPEKILYLDQDITGAQQTQEVPAVDNQGLLSTYVPLLSSIIGTGTSSQLLSTFEQDPELRSRIETPIRPHLLAGEYIFSMSGFFDSSFITYDFYQGMLAARSWLAGRLGSAEATADVVEEVDKAIKKSSQRYQCLLDIAEQDMRSNPASVPSCRALSDDTANYDGKLNRNLFALTRALARLESVHQGKQPPSFEQLMLALEYDEQQLPALAASNNANSTQNTSTGTPTGTNASISAVPFFHETPFRTIELLSWKRWFHDESPLHPADVIPTLRWRGDLLFENWVKLQPDWTNKVILETLGDAFLNHYLIRLPDRRYGALGINTEGLEFRFADSWFNRRHFRGHTSIEWLGAALPDTQAPLTHYYRWDPAISIGLTFLPLVDEVPFLGKAPEYLALGLTLRGVARTALFGSEATVVSFSPELGAFRLYPEVEVSLIVLDRLEPYFRFRLPCQYGELILPELQSGLGITRWDFGMLLHF